MGKQLSQLSTASNVLIDRCNIFFGGEHSKNIEKKKIKKKEIIREIRNLRQG